MTFDEFAIQADNDPNAAALILAVAQKAGDGAKSALPPSYSGLETAAVGLAAYALYRWLKNYFDRKRGIDDLDMAKKQLQLVADLEKEGVARASAEKTVASMLTEIRDRGLTDPAVQTLLMLTQLAGSP